MPAVWAKVWRLLSDDVYFEARVKAKVEDMRTMEATAQADANKIESALDDIQMQRQQVMNWALAKRITEADMDLKLAALSIEESGKRRALSDTSLLLGNRADKLMEFAGRAGRARPLHALRPAKLALHEEAGMGKLVRTVFLSIVFIGTLVIGVIATGHGAEAWASIRPLFVGIADFFKITLP